jgi:hypothetical protein
MRAEMTHKNIKSARCSLLRAEGFSCSLGCLGMRKLQFVIKNIKSKFLSCKIISIFGHQSPGSATGFGSAIRKNAGSRSGDLH